MTTDERALATEVRLNTLMETLAEPLASVHQRIDDLRHTIQIGFTVVAAIGAILGAIAAAQLTALIVIARALPK
jgi:hypothetical protein